MAEYETDLPSDKEPAFEAWKQRYAPNDSGVDYDLRGAFLADVHPDEKTGHFPDTFKKPNHPTFSVESQYAKDRPDLAGSWSGDKYVSASGTESERVRETAAKRMARGTLRGDKTPDTALEKVGSDEDYEKLPFGKQFVDPEGNRRTKPWTVTDDDSFSEVPEGAQFVDPEGNVREKPTSQSISFTAQTLFNMATNDKERKKALEQAYPGKVTKVSKEWQIDDDGTLRKPKGLTDTATGFGAGIVSEAAPIGLGVLGEVGGGIAGSAVAPGLGTAAGALGGAAGGAALGQGFNDLILQLSGVYDRTAGEEVGGLALAGGASALGSAGGRALAGAAPAIKGGLKDALPKAAANFLGADEEGLRTAIQMREKGIALVPPSMWAKESPHLHNIAEVLDPAFRTQQPMRQAAEEHYEKSGSDIAKALGATPGKLLNTDAKVSSREAGEKVLLKTREESAVADAKLAAEFEARKTAMVAGGPKGPDSTSLKRAEQESRQAAQKLIDLGFEDIEKTTQDALKLAKSGSNSGDLWWNVAEKLKAIRTGVVKRAEKMYGEADMLAGGNKPDSAGLPIRAQEFLEEVPPDFKNRYPSIVQKLEALAGKKDPKTGEWIKEPYTPSFGELHNVRSMLRSGADWYTLSSDVKNGSFKFFAKMVDDVLHDEAAVPELKAAAEALNKADQFYAENMKVFNARNLKTVMDGLKAGEPADPTVLFNAIVKEGHSDLTKKIMDMIGPNLASGVRAADVRTMLDNSQSLVPGEIDGMKFANEVLTRVRSNMLDTIHGPQMGDKLRKQAQYIAALEGKIDIPTRPGDTALDVIGRARVAADEAKAAAKADPLAVLARDTKKMEAEKARSMSKMQRERRADPLGFLFDPKIGAVDAADRILANEDLILAAAAKFGEDSAEFGALRQVYLMRILQGGMDVGNKLGSISPEIQNIMFPGVTKSQLQTLSKEMEFLLSTRAMSQGTGKSIMATARVEHPWGAIPLGKTAGKVVPGWDAAGRGMLGKYYKFVTEMSNNLAFLRWVEKGLKGDPTSRAVTRETVQKFMKRGGAVGAGVAESQEQTPQQPE